MQKEYTEEFKKIVEDELKMGLSISGLSEIYGVNKKTLEKWKKKLKVPKIKSKDHSCHKKVPTYKAISEVKKGTVYDSKLGGIPYIPEGEEWVTCPKCKSEKVLLVQLDISELPEVSKALKDWDFVQVYACMKPSDKLLEEEEYFNDYVTANSRGENDHEGYLGEFFYARLEANRCYNIVERNSKYDFAFDERVDGKSIHPREPFNLYFDIQLVKKNKSARVFSVAPWVEKYNLYLNEEREKVHSHFYDDKRTYVWAEQQCFSEKIIDSWEKAKEVECYYHSEVLDMCSGNTSEDLLGMADSYWMQEEFEIQVSEMVGDSYYCKNEKEERDAKALVSCPCCNKPLTLLFQFAFSADEGVCLKGERDSYDTNTYALFYCEDDPEVMSCLWGGSDY